MTIVTKFRVALSADFLNADGTPAFPDFDLTPLRADRRVEIGYVPAPGNVIPATALEDYDALILFAFQMRKSSLPAGRRLGVVARLGVGYDSVHVEALAREHGVRLVSLETLFAESDIVTVNCPLSPATRGLVDAKRLASMKSTAYLINTARGAIVDQKALTAALQAGRIAGAGLDVF